ncbi:MAG: PIN domain-containing protein [Aeromicrobium sp.]|uniref:PIN domain-containing protein n=1 Tax=Aeromicrobium sp. TaxID=1871063 RepID=UPI0039E61591
MTSRPTDILPLPVVLSDANVLYSRVIRDYLVYASDQQILTIKWTTAILDEVVRNLASNRPNFTHEAGARLIGLLNTAYPFAEVEVTAQAWESVSAFPLPDEDDRHVLAAAVAAEADILCTDNIKDFPSAVMDQIGVQAMTADDLLSHLAIGFPAQMRAAHRLAVSRLPGATDASTLAALRRAGCPVTAGRMAALLA